MIYKRCHLKLPDYTNVHELAQCWFNYYCARDVETISNDESAIDMFVQNYCSLVLCENKNLAA